jgi:hypothetical protein
VELQKTHVGCALRHKYEGVTEVTKVELARWTVIGDGRAIENAAVRFGRSRSCGWTTANRPRVASGARRNCAIPSNGRAF